MLKDISIFLKIAPPEGQHFFKLSMLTNNISHTFLKIANKGSHSMLVNSLLIKTGADKTIPVLYVENSFLFFKSALKVSQKSGGR